MAEGFTSCTRENQTVVVHAPLLVGKPKAAVLGHASDSQRDCRIRYAKILECEPEILHIARFRCWKAEALLRPTVRRDCCPGGSTIGRSIRRAWSSGHHGLLGHRGATRVMVACSLTSFARSLWMRASGGKHQAFSPVRGKRSPSFATENGSGRQETYLRVCRLRRFANKSMPWGPHRRSACLKCKGKS